jgi:hypothetical protein
MCTCLCVVFGESCMCAFSDWPVDECLVADRGELGHVFGMYSV